MWLNYSNQLSIFLNQILIIFCCRLKQVLVPIPPYITSYLPTNHAALLIIIFLPLFINNIFLSPKIYISTKKYSTFKWIQQFRAVALSHVPPQIACSSHHALQVTVDFSQDQPITITPILRGLELVCLDASLFRGYSLKKCICIALCQKLQLPRHSVDISIWLWQFSHAIAWKEQFEQMIRKLLAIIFLSYNRWTEQGDLFLFKTIHDESIWFLFLLTNRSNFYSYSKMLQTRGDCAMVNPLSIATWLSNQALCFLFESPTFINWFSYGKCSSALPL